MPAGPEELRLQAGSLSLGLEGCDARAICLAEMRRGQLPPGVLGKPVVEEIFPMVERIATEAERLAGSGPGTSIDVRLDLPDGRALTGTVGGVRGDVHQTHDVGMDAGFRDYGTAVAGAYQNCGPVLKVENPLRCGHIVGK